jgi:hypothetical protein
LEGGPIKGAVVFPGATGGGNWGGTASDPATGYVFAHTMDDGMLGRVEKIRGALRCLTTRPASTALASTGANLKFGWARLEPGRAKSRREGD